MQTDTPTPDDLRAWREREGLTQERASLYPGDSYIDTAAGRRIWEG